jgi:hypothetical protein
MITAVSSSLFQTPQTNVFSPDIVPPLNQLQEYVYFKYTGDSADDDRTLYCQICCLKQLFDWRDDKQHEMVSYRCRIKKELLQKKTHMKFVVSLGYKV